MICSSASAPSGSPRCPCLSSLSTFGMPAGFNLTPTVDGVSFNYGSTYGIDGCRPHDLGLQPSCSTDACESSDSASTARFYRAPAWCVQSWCYINTSQCGGANSTFAPQLSTYNWSLTSLHDEHSELAYSYATCGACDQFTAFPQPEAKVVNSREAILVAVGLGAALVIVLLAVVWRRAYKKKKESRRRRMRHVVDRSAVCATQLDAKRGITFHLFLSHSWGTGADRMRLLKTQLSLAVPDLVVFLDIDDMDGGRGVEYIDRPRPNHRRDGPWRQHSSTHYAPRTLPSSLDSLSSAAT